MLQEPQVTAIAELLRMEDERALDLGRLRTLASDPLPEIRSRVALAIGRVHDRAGLDLLLAAAADSAPQVRASAVFALGLLGDTSAVVVETVASALEGADSAALESPAALARLNTGSAYRVLATALAQPGGKGAFRATLLREALLSIWRFSSRPAADSLVSPYTRDPVAEIRWAAAYALMRMGNASAMPTLVDLLADPDDLVRATAARGLRPASAESAGVAPRALAALRSALSDREPHVRINAARAFAAFHAPDAASAIAPLFQDDDGNVRVAAAEALASVSGSEAARALEQLAGSGGAPLALRAAALASLVRADSTAAHRVAAGWLTAPEWLQRFYAVRALAALAWPIAGTQLLAAARDADPRVQAEAVGALAAVDSTAPLAAIFLEALASRDPLVRGAAATGLGRRRDAAYFSALMTAYERAERDTINDAALAIVDALAWLGSASVPVAHTFFGRFRPARDPVVRARVAHRLGTGNGTWGEPRPTRTGRSLPFYQQVVRDLVAPRLAAAAPPRVRIRTARGDIILELDPAQAPLTVHNFLALIRTGFYQHAALRWHRVVPNFVLQDGDPRGDGSGGPPDIIRDEINTLRYRRGVLGMALSGADTGGSQFFITHSPQPHLDGGYTIFGHVVEGMDVADRILQDDAILAIEEAS